MYFDTSQTPTAQHPTTAATSGSGAGARIEVAIIIVNYKSAELTLRALESLQKERVRPELSLSVLVVENASGDEEALREGIAASFSDFARLVVSPVNGGFGAGNNLAIRVLKEEGRLPRYVHFLNPDTIAYEGAVAALVRFLEAHPRAGAAGSRFEHEDGTPWPFAFRFPTPLSEVETGASLRVVSRLLERHAGAMKLGNVPVQVDWLSGASFMMRREVLEQIGGFDEAYFLYYEETDLCRRAKQKGWQMWYVPDSRVMHIRGQSTGVTCLRGKPRRLPGYWFESRRRYFTKNHGLGYALAADLAAVAGNGIGAVKNVLKRRPTTPRLVRDLLMESVIFPKNRSIAPERVDL